MYIKHCEVPLVSVPRSVRLPSQSLHLFDTQSADNHEVHTRTLGDLAGAI